MSLPDWEPGTVAVLSTGAGPPHAIPVSTAVKTGPSTILFALSRRRESLARQREDPRGALTLFGPGNFAVTAPATAVIVEEPMQVSDRVVAIRLDVHEVQDHWQPGFEIEAGVAWRWTDDDAASADAEIRSALRALG